MKVLTIDGNIYNEEFTAFQKELNGLNSPSEKDLEQKAEEFIQQHHSSFVSLYLLDKYFVQKERKCGGDSLYTATDKIISNRCR